MAAPSDPHELLTKVELLTVMVPSLSKPPASDVAARKAWFRNSHSWTKIDAAVADRYRDVLVTWYGAEKGKKVKYAEAFEICEYGRRVTPEQLKKLFPFQE